MKMIMAVVSGDDSNAVSAALTKARFSVTKLATTGGFLMSGNTTFLIGVDDDKVSEVIDNVLGIFEKHSKKRKQMVPSAGMVDVGMYSAFPVEVTVGGAIVFVMNVERFEKV